MSSSEPTTPSAPSGRRWLVIGVIVAGVIAASVLFDVRSLVRAALAWIEGLGGWGPVLFVILYVLSTVLFVPGSVLTLSAGALFGVAAGSLYVSLGATLGATAAFLIGRYFARGWIAKKIEGNASFTAIDQAVAREGWKIVGLTRLSPAFPFSLLNYAFGLTRVGLRDYVLASWIGMMPGTVMYVYLGSLARAGAGGGTRTPGEWGLYGVGLVATIAVTVIITRIARQALAKHTQAEASSTTQ